MTPCGQCSGERELGIDRPCPIQVFHGTPIVGLGHCQYGLKCLCPHGNCDRITLRLWLGGACLHVSDADWQGARDTFRYLSLQFRRAFGRALERIAPDLTSRCNVDQTDDHQHTPSDRNAPGRERHTARRATLRGIIGGRPIAIRRQHVEPSSVRQCRDYPVGHRLRERRIVGFRVRTCEGKNHQTYWVGYGVQRQWQGIFANARNVADGSSP